MIKTPFSENNEWARMSTYNGEDGFHVHPECLLMEVLWPRFPKALMKQDKLLYTADASGFNVLKHDPIVGKLPEGYKLDLKTLRNHTKDPDKPLVVPQGPFWFITEHDEKLNLEPNEKGRVPL